MNIKIETIENEIIAEEIRIAKIEQQILIEEILPEKIENEIATIENKELIVLNYTDGKYYTYSNEYLKEICVEFVEESQQNGFDFIQAIEESNFWQFVVNRVLQHREEDSYYMIANGQQCDEIALSENPCFI
tara:strand:- start:198 stop:593 length:396 start_codon:yes stop_codon:yes gene_type:complete